MKERIAYFDNAKAILIILVVVGHFIDFCAMENPILFPINYVIYCFHMPAFILLSGYFSKDETNTASSIKKYLLYYVIFETIYYAAIREGTIFIRPQFVTWYLLSLVFWKLMIKSIERNKYAVIIAFSIGILSGLLPFVGDDFSLSRTLYFFPFFAMGHKMQNKYFISANLKKDRFISAIIMLSFFAIVVLNQQIFAVIRPWLSGNQNYNAQRTGIYGMLFRIMAYSISIILCKCFYLLVPKKTFKFTYIGKNTLNVFTIHGFFVIALSPMIMILGVTLQIVCIILLSVIITLFLSSNVVNNVIHVFRVLNKDSKPVT